MVNGKFIYYVLVGVGAIIGLLLRKKLKEISADTASLVILGMKQTGKTRWLSFLRGVKYIEGSTADREEFSEFDFIRANGNKMKIKAGYDYGGSVENVGRYYKQALDVEGKIAIMFFFNMYKYVRNDDEIQKGETITYRRAIVARLGYIERLMKKKNIDKEMFYLVMTYKDKVEENGFAPPKKMTEIIAELRDRFNLNELIGDNVIAINTTDKKQLEELKNKLKL